MSTTAIAIAIAVAVAVFPLLWRRLSRLAGAVVYARIRRNRISLRRIDTGKEVDLAAEQPFSHTRMLLGNFTSADALMKKGLADLKGVTAPVVVVHPLETLEGGLTEIEERALQELAMGAGAGRALVWVGAELSDAQVHEKARS
jgi:hypothetical protein